ncbi:MAG: two-component system sensor histidine kinase TtrS [Sulfurimonas sp.]|jgi:two-component system sensor histidine kinase TtrS
MNTIEELNKLKRKNILLEQSLKQNHTLRKNYNDAINRLKQRDKELEELNNSLEIKVQQRTTELSKMYKHEQHIKEMMKMVADVNEFLVASMNLQAIIESSIANVCNFDDYNFCWFGMRTSYNTLEIVNKSDDTYNLLSKKEYNISEDNQNILVQAAIDSYQSSKIIHIENLPLLYPQLIKPSTSDYKIGSSVCIPLYYDGEESPFSILTICSSQDKIDNEETEILKKLGKDIAFAMSISRHRNVLEQLELEKLSNYEETILAFVDIIEQRDSYTAGHTIRVAHYCGLIARHMNIKIEDIHKLEKAAILHDIGKVVTPDSILLKPGKLSALEYDLIKQHATSGYKMLSKIAMYQDLADIIRHHHEHYDGSGYPDALKGNEISMLTHIMIVADAFDAMTTDRIYKGRKTVDEALLEIKSLSKIHFHPDVVNSALEVLRETEIHNTSQMPNSNLEQKRFSYFFEDPLTSVYNENYLSTILNKDFENFKCINLLQLRNFSAYNRKHGWEEGNNLLIKLAREFENKYPHTDIFRFHGDDFILLHSKHVEIDLEELNTWLQKNHGVYFDLHHYDATEFDSAKALLSELA